MTDDEKGAYSRGYNAGLRGYLPSHMPPEPPEGWGRDAVKALESARQAIDEFSATWDPDDDPLVNVAQDLVDCLKKLRRHYQCPDSPAPARATKKVVPLGILCVMPSGRISLSSSFFPCAPTLVNPMAAKER